VIIDTSAIIAILRSEPDALTFAELISTAEIAVVPVTEAQARRARAAYRDFGKGSGHPAGLNFGDCFAYALAQECQESLLFKGKDFIHTDVRAALDSG
jgi:ribonuclease VapC